MSIITTIIHKEKIVLIYSFQNSKEATIIWLLLKQEFIFNNYLPKLLKILRKSICFDDVYSLVLNNMNNEEIDQYEVGCFLTNSHLLFEN